MALRPTERSVLLLTDIQPDFMPGGALAVAGGDAILEPVKALLDSPCFPLRVATQDWHPEGHISFASAHAGRKPLDSITLYGHEQTLWPDHCVQGTSGAALDPRLDWRSVSAIIRKGSERRCDSYSGFRNNWNEEGERPPTGLAGYLRERGIEELFICGLTRDYCVKWSAEDAVSAGFRVWVLWDCTRPVDPGSDTAVRDALTELGVRIINSTELDLAGLQRP